MKKAAIVLAAFLTLGALPGTAVAVIGFDNGTITDPATNLVWLKNANCFGKTTFKDAWGKSKSLANGACGLSDGSKANDWRLPTSNELVTIYANKSKFKNIQTDDYYWSRTDDDKCDYLSFDMRLGKVVTCREEGYVWPVRAIR